MATEDVSNGESIILEKPERGAKEGYLVAYFNASTHMNRVIAESNGISDHRFRLLTLKMIGGVTDEKIRQEMFDYFFQELKKINHAMGEDGRSLSIDEKSQLIADLCCGEMQGHITSFYDEFLGITHRLRVGTV